ncbi:hypothetical protein RUND412_011159, partial [Rhizina undulata]
MNTVQRKWKAAMKRLTLNSTVRENTMTGWNYTAISEAEIVKIAARPAPTAHSPPPTRPHAFTRNVAAIMEELNECIPDPRAVNSKAHDSFSSASKGSHDVLAYVPNGVSK